MRSVALVLMLLISPVAHTNWSTSDTARQLVFTGLQVVDWAQTREIARNPHYYEVNPILGSSPSAVEVNAYFLATTVGHYAVARALPPHHRKVWQYVWIGAQAATVTHNYQIGIRIDF